MPYIGFLAVEHFVGLYVFVTYLDETDFLFDRQSVSYELDLHGSFYAGIVSFACSVVAALVVYMDESIYKAHKASTEDDDNIGYMLPEDFVLYEPDNWNMMDDYQWNDEGKYLVEQNDKQVCTKMFDLWAYCIWEQLIVRFESLTCDQILHLYITA